MASGTERRGPIPIAYDNARILSLHTPSELRDFLCHPMHRYSPDIQIHPRTLALTLGQMTDKNNKLIIARPDLKRMGTFEHAGDIRDGYRTNNEEFNSLRGSIPYIFYNTSEITQHVRRQDQESSVNGKFMACTNYQAVKASLICAFGFAHAVYRKDRPWNQIGDHVAALSQTHRGIYQGLSRYVNELNKNDAFEPEQFVDFVFKNNLIQESDEVGIQVCPAPKPMILKVVKCMTDNPRENSGITPLSYQLGIDRNLRTDSLASFCSRVLECEIGWKEMEQVDRNFSAIVVNKVLGYPLQNVRMV